MIPFFGMGADQVAERAVEKPGTADSVMLNGAGRPDGRGGSRDGEDE